jgi:UPF0755 protein
VLTARRAVAIAVVTLLVAAAAAAGWLWSALWRPRTTTVVELVIEEGSSGRRVLERLASTGLVPSRLAGRLYLRAAGRGRSLHFGHYRFASGARPVDALERILDGRVEMTTVTVLEGSDVADLASQMAAAGLGSEAEWLAVAGRTDWIADVAPEATSLEGFLFPDTYSFAVGTGVETAARHLVERFRSVWHEERARLDAEPWGSPFEVLVLASLVEAETPVAGERERVAGVYLNRLRRGMLLQCDPTVVYALKRQGAWTGRLLRVHWGLDDPYNTYRYPGLPPGPINSPGRASIRAALDPEAHEYLYFVAAPGGGHAFSRTLAEHNRAVAVWQRSRR